MTVGVVSLAFAKYSEDKEPNPVNRRLAKDTERIVDKLADFGDEAMVVSQWEITRQLERDGYFPFRSVGLGEGNFRRGQRYLDTADVLRIAADTFAGFGITDVVIVANPFIHRGMAEKMMENKGFNVLKDHPIDPIPWDDSPENLQWWCKGPLRFLSYGAIVTFGKILRLDLHGIGERRAT